MSFARRLGRRTQAVLTQPPVLHIIDKPIRAGDPLVFICTGCGTVLVDRPNEPTVACECGAELCEDCTGRRKAKLS